MVHFCTNAYCIPFHPEDPETFSLPFQSTVEFQSNDDIMQELEKFGGMADCSSFRYSVLNSV